MSATSRKISDEFCFLFHFQKQDSPTVSVPSSPQFLSTTSNKVGLYFSVANVYGDALMDFKGIMICAF